jgi:hypothetical protein
METTTRTPRITKKAQQRQLIMSHGFKLITIFKLPAFPATYPSVLCKALRRLEVKMHRANENYCNGIMESEAHDKLENSVLNKVDDLLGFRALGIPVFINSDPRGYALKIKSEYVADNNLDIHRDWGGYGIICPEIN